jgi:nitrile hydratase
VTGPSDPEQRVKALEQVLVEKGYVAQRALDVIAETYAHNIGPQNGARVVARSWRDPDYRKRLLEDGTAAIAEQIGRAHV